MLSSRWGGVGWGGGGGGGGLIVKVGSSRFVCLGIFGGVVVVV